MNDEYNGELEFDGHTLFWRQFKVVDGKRGYGKYDRTGYHKGWCEANYEAVNVEDLYKDLYDALYKALSKKLGAVSEN
jgi:hypothetical protein